MKPKHTVKSVAKKLADGLRDGSVALDKPLTDAECEELMSLYRIVRNGNDWPGECERLKELMRRFYATKN